MPVADPSFRFRCLFARTPGLEVPEGAEPIGDPVGGVQVYDWTSPLGHWWFNGSCYAQLVDENAMQRFLADAYAPYQERYGDDYGDLIVAEFTDEPCAIFRDRLPAGAVPFGNAVLERFEAMHGEDAGPKLHLLFRDDAEGSAAAFRIRYHRTLNNLFEKNFTGQLSSYCEEHGIALTGHYMSEQSVYDQQLWGVKIMPNYRHQHVPGIDHLGRQVDERLTPKQCQSVVNQFDKPRMLTELYGCVGGSMSFEDRWWIASQQIALGANLLNHHLSLYTMAGCRKRDYPQNMFYQQSWWGRNEAIDRPLSRLCLAMCQGRYAAEALVLHPQESAFALWEGDASRTEPGLATWDMKPLTGASHDAIQSINSRFMAVIDGLLDEQRCFDLGDETILAEDGSVEHGDGAACCASAGWPTRRSSSRRWSRSRRRRWRCSRASSPAAGG